jgi:hypothetical protein
MKINFNATQIESGDEYNYEGDKIENNKEMVLKPNQEYTLVISYPLHNPAKFTFYTHFQGMTRAKLVALIRKYYKKVYAEEDKSVGKKTDCIPGMFNRDTSNGKYGIWGHHIGDLVLVNAKVSKKNVITLGVDS